MQENLVRVELAALEVQIQRFGQTLEPKRERVDVSAFAVHEDDAGGKVEVTDAECAELGFSKAAPAEQHDRRLVAQAFLRTDESFQFAAAE